MNKMKAEIVFDSLFSNAEFGVTAVGFRSCYFAIFSRASLEISARYGSELF